MAKKREYDEPFTVTSGDEKEVMQKIKENGLCYTRGERFFHLLGNSNKGKATVIMKNLYSQEHSNITTIGIGDSRNDLPMLKLADKAFWLNKISLRSLQKTRYDVWLEIFTTISKLQTQGK